LILKIKVMNAIKLALFGIILSLAALAFSSCKKLAGLPLQENTTHVVSTIDPHIHKSALQFLMDRALGSVPDDTIFKRMYQAVLYSGIDTAEYSKAGRTFLFLHNDAVYRLASNKITTDCIFGHYLAGGKPATKWEDYSPGFVKNYLLSLMVDGEYSFENVGPDPVVKTTLMPAGTDTLNPKSKIVFTVVNDRNSRFTINGFPGSAFPAPNLTAPGLAARTAGILSTNGPVHVVDRVVFYQVQ